MKIGIDYMKLAVRPFKVVHRRGMRIGTRLKPRTTKGGVWVGGAPSWHEDEHEAKASHYIGFIDIGL
jgi:hypothetical protein